MTKEECDRYFFEDAKELGQKSLEIFNEYVGEKGNALPEPVWDIIVGLADSYEVWFLK